MPSVLIQPLRRDDALLADIAAARADSDPTKLHAWWLGQSGFLVLHAGRFLLFDPYLSDSLTKKYAATDKPHVRMTERVVDPARLDFVDVVTTSHNHTDHLDAETLQPLLTASPQAQLIAPAANLSFVQERLGAGLRDRVVPVALGGKLTIAGFTLEAVPAAHEALSPAYCGYVATAGPFRIYHSGDTVLYPGMAEKLKPFAVDLALLPINGRAPERRVAGNLDGLEAARLAREIGTRWVVPCHYEMFEFNTASPVAFAGECARLGQPCLIPRAGERVTLAARP